MPHVTSVETQKKNQSRFSIYVDGSFYCGVDEEVLLKYGIKKGLEVGQLELEQILQESEINKVYAKALDYLARRPRSEREMRDYIRKKVFTYKLSAVEEGDSAIEQVVDALILRLVKLKYIDDREFTRWWIEQRTQKAKPDSLIKIKSELIKKGISPNLTESVWKSMGMSSEDLLDKLLEKVKDRYDLSDSKDKKRLVDYLMRRGYSWADIKPKVA
ncbi:RecX family transcriptional regulator [candidate division WWE3 bacterium]|uniref:Regulatory protein RecX n=1 Tax=candidate division WWE3 bacterium TaxID=2053526 RepID=A0A955RRK3_UNCKA|nr:RecX family transcriptional regulator [candidate division WWE3 bacterium]